MSVCDICPRACLADRSAETGYCGARANPNIARAALHFFEEPCISGTAGSGAVFFSGCNLHCLFCQNYVISNCLIGREYDADGLAEIMLNLQAASAHNVNLVTPSPHVNIIVEAIMSAKKKGLKIPVVYNTNAYEKVETLKRLEGLVDVYLPDIKYVSSSISKRYSDAEDYFEYASGAITEMYRQVGNLYIGDSGLAERGMLIRHLVLPGSIDETRLVLDYIRNAFSVRMYISLMSQYVPGYEADFPPLNRRLLKREYERAIDYCALLGFENVYVQKMSSAKSEYTPDFNGEII